MKIYVIVGTYPDWDWEWHEETLDYFLTKEKADEICEQLNKYCRGDKDEENYEVREVEVTDNPSDETIEIIEDCKKEKGE